MVCGDRPVVDRIHVVPRSPWGAQWAAERLKSKCCGLFRASSHTPVSGSGVSGRLEGGRLWPEVQGPPEWQAFPGPAYPSLLVCSRPLPQPRRLSGHGSDRLKFRPWGQGQLPLLLLKSGIDRLCRAGVSEQRSVERVGTHLPT